MHSTILSVKHVTPFNLIIQLIHNTFYSMVEQNIYFNIITLHPVKGQ